jgi:hypothetical protein
VEDSRTRIDKEFDRVVSKNPRMVGRREEVNTNKT